VASPTKSHPPASGERVDLDLVQCAPTIRLFEPPAFLLEVRITTKIFQAKPGASSDCSSSYALGFRQSAWLIDVVSTAKLSFNRPVEMIRAREAAQNTLTAQRALPWRQGTRPQLVWRAPTKQVPISAFGHPTGSRQVGVPGPSRAFGLACRIDLEDDQGDLAPVGPFRVRIEQAQIRHEMLFVVTRQDAGAGCGVGNRWVKQWRLHASVPTNSNTLPCVTNALLKLGCVNDAGLAEGAPRSGA